MAKEDFYIKLISNPVVILIFVVYLFYLTYYSACVPCCFRRRYKKYQNLKMSDKFYFSGDLKITNQNEKAKKFKFQHFIDYALSFPDTDIILVQIGTRFYFDLCSPKAYREFNLLVPDKIDRYDHKGLWFGNVATRSFPLMETNSESNKRRKLIMEKIANFLDSNFALMVTKTADECINNLTSKEKVDIGFEIRKITYRIMTKILCGKDIQKLGKCTYFSPNNQPSKSIDFDEFYALYSADRFSEYFSSSEVILPFTSKMRVGEPFASNDTNMKALYLRLKKFLSISDDDDSIYRQIIELNKFDEDDVFHDILMLIFGCSGLISPVITSIIYYLHKYPESRKNLIDSLHRCDLANNDAFTKENLLENLENCDYLHYVVKEGLRIDPPSITSMIYFTKEDIEICNIPLRKGSMITINSIFPHYNQNEWHEPTEFIPERFDQESKYFYKPNSTTKRDSNSFIPFSFGKRGCIGENLSMVIIKAILSRLIVGFKFEIDEELLENDEAKFNMFSQFKLTGSIH